MEESQQGNLVLSTELINCKLAIERVLKLMCQALALHQSEHAINRLALPLGFSSNNNYTVVIFHNGNGESLRISNLPPLSNIDIEATIPLTSMTLGSRSFTHGIQRNR